MSGEQMRLQVLPKLFRVNSWITQMIGSEFQTVGLATENAQVAKVLRVTCMVLLWKG